MQKSSGLKEKLAIIWSILLASYLGAHYAEKLMKWNFAVVFILSAITMGALIYCVMHLLLKRLEKEAIAYEKHSNKIKAELQQLTPKQAKQLAIDAIQSGAFEATAATKDTSTHNIPSTFAPQLRDFFSLYSRVTDNYMDLDLASVGPSEIGAGFIRIGSGLDHSEYAVKPAEETIYELDHEYDGDGFIIVETYPSIYHMILALYEE